MQSKLVLVSGGLDSIVALLASRREGHCTALHFDYGTKQNEVELGYTRRQCQKLGIELYEMKLDLFKQFKSGLFLGDVQRGGDAIVPFRNGIFISIAAGIAMSRGLDEIVLASHFNDSSTFPDCTQKFSETMSRAIEAGTGGKVKLATPFSIMYKHDIVVLGEKLGADFSLTYSCYRGEAQHCGICPTCIERKEAFKTAGVEDPTIYER